MVSAETEFCLPATEFRLTFGPVCAHVVRTTHPASQRITYLAHLLILSRPADDTYGELAPMVSPALEWGHLRVEIRAPVGVELLRAQGLEGVIAGVAHPVVLSHPHQRVVDVQGVLKGGDEQS